MFPALMVCSKTCAHCCNRCRLSIEFNTLFSDQALAKRGPLGNYKVGWPLGSPYRRYCLWASHRGMVWKTRVNNDKLRLACTWQRRCVRERRRSTLQSTIRTASRWIGGQCVVFGEKEQTFLRSERPLVCLKLWSVLVNRRRGLEFLHLPSAEYAPVAMASGVAQIY